MGIITSYSQTRAFFIVAFTINTILLPIVFIVIYEYFAGGVLNGFWGQYSRGVVDGEILTTVIYPVSIIVAYALLLYSFKVHVQNIRSNHASMILPVIGVVVATAVTTVIVVWRLVTT